MRTPTSSRASPSSSRRRASRTRWPSTCGRAAPSSSPTPTTSALEGLITDGHRYHPAYKSRIGFDLDDDLAYGPEFLPVLHPFWVAAHRSVAEVTTSAVDPPDPRAELGPTAAAGSTPRSATPAATRPTR